MPHKKYVSLTVNSYVIFYNLCTENTGEDGGAGERS